MTLPFSQPGPRAPGGFRRAGSEGSRSTFGRDSRGAAPGYGQGYPRYGYGHPGPGYAGPGHSGPGYPGGGAGGPQRPQRRNRPRLVLLATLVVLGAAIIALLAVNSRLSGGDDQPYANEDYSPPPVETQPEQIPVPTDYDELYAMLYDNPLNNYDVDSPIACRIGEVQVDQASAAEVEAHFNELTGCLMTTWINPMTDAGWTLYRPQVTVYEGSISTPCGDLPEMNAVYCSANQQLYFSMDLPDLPTLEDQADNPTAFDLTMAHEFGHAIQGRSGQLAAALILSQEMSEADALLLSRQQETQADCYAALYIASATQSTPYDAADRQNFLDISNNFGSDVISGDPTIVTTHPRGATRQYWTEVGLSTTEIGRCNTYIVGDPDYSN